MNLKKLLMLKAATGVEVKSCEPIYFSASGMSTPSATPTTSNSRGTTISTTSAAENSVVVTQVPNYDKDPPTSYNGYLFIGFDKLIEWVNAGKTLIFDADIDITENPFEVTELTAYISSKNNTSSIENGKIHATISGVGEYARNYVELRCSGCSFTLSNCVLSIE